MRLEEFLLIEIISAFLLIIFIFFLIHKGRTKRSNLLLALFFFAQVMGIFSDISFSNTNYFINNIPDLLFIGVPFGLLWAPGLYLYVGSVTNDRFWINKWNFAHLIPFLIYVFFFLIEFHIVPAEDKILKIESISRGYMLGFQYQHLLNIQLVVYNAFSLLALYKYRKKLLNTVSSVEKINLQWLTYVIYGYVVTCFLDDLALKYMYDFLPIDPLLVSRIIFLIFFTILFYKGFTCQEVFLLPINKLKYKTSTLTRRKANEILQKMNILIEENKPHLNPDLTIKKLAEELEVQDRHLSQVINEYKKQNFYDFINSLRICEAKKMLSDPSNKYNILQILYEVGFNSKTAFNKAFKKQTGVTPSMFKKRIEYDYRQFTGLQYSK